MAVEEAQREGLGGGFEELVTATKKRVQGVVELAAAEARLAALSGLAMLLLVLVAAAALVVGWVLLVACLLYLISLLGIAWLWPGFGFALAHALLAFYLWQVAVRLSRNLTLPELRTSLLRRTPASVAASDDSGGLVASRS
jgi:hypothetical protein